MEKHDECTPGQTIYEVARDNGILFPVLCHHDQLKPVGACRVCVVEVAGGKTLVASCAMPAEKGMVVLPIPSGYRRQDGSRSSSS